MSNGTLSANEVRQIGFPWSPQMAERARRSAGATVAAAKSSLRDRCGINLAGGTHHAFADRGEGYCVFNDVAVAARLLLARGLASRLLVVDCDVHQGNGTASIFSHEPAVFTLSLHGAKNFPFRKERSDLDVELPDGTSDEAYLEALDGALAEAFDRQRPELVFYVAGADPHAEDRLGRLALTFEGLAARDRLVFDVCRTAGAPVATCMAGGYAPNVETIVRVHANTVREAARHHVGAVPVDSPGTLSRV